MRRGREKVIINVKGVNVGREGRDERGGEEEGSGDCDEGTRGLGSGEEGEGEGSLDDISWRGWEDEGRRGAGGSSGGGGGVEQRFRVVNCLEE